jgi:hypothetical protein
MSEATYGEYSDFAGPPYPPGTLNVSDDQVAWNGEPWERVKIVWRSGLPLIGRYAVERRITIKPEGGSLPSVMVRPEKRGWCFRRRSGYETTPVGRDGPNDVDWGVATEEILESGLMPGAKAIAVEELGPYELPPFSYPPEHSQTRNHDHGIATPRRRDDA